LKSRQACRARQSLQRTATLTVRFLISLLPASSAVHAIMIEHIAAAMPQAIMDVVSGAQVHIA